MIGEQAALTVETVAFGIIKAGTTLYYANGTARTDVNTPLTRDLQRKAIRGLKRQLARPFTKKISSSPNFGAESVRASFIGLTLLRGELYQLTGTSRTEYFNRCAMDSSSISNPNRLTFMRLNSSRAARC